MGSFLDISLIRVIGVLTGVVLLTSVFLRLRLYKSRRINNWIFFLIGLSLLLVGILPESINFVSQVFFLYEVKGGRVVTMLLILSILFWFIVLRERVYRVKQSQNFDRLWRKVIELDTVNHYTIDNLSFDIAVIIPAFNEEKNLEVILPKIPRIINEKTIATIIVDDGSSDNTQELVKGMEGVIYVQHPFNRGGGAALRSGYHIAKLVKANIVVSMDADGQHHPSEISTLINPIITGQADIVIGSRFLGKSINASKIREIGIHFFNFVISNLLGINVTDCTSGFRAFKSKELSKLSLWQDQYHTAELIIDAAKRRSKIIECPITISERIHGFTKKGTNITYAFSFLKVVLRTWLRNSD